MPFCMQCGHALTEKIPPGDERVRLVCPSCAFIAYTNPKVVVATLPIVDGRVLLLRRGIEPRLGAWTYAGGFLEMGETTEEGARREAREELKVDVGDLDLLGVYSRPHAGVVVVVYVSRSIQGEPQRTPEASEVAFFAPEEIPWEGLAFPTTEVALKDWISTRKRRP